MRYSWVTILLTLVFIFLLSLTSRHQCIVDSINSKLYLLCIYQYRHLILLAAVSYGLVIYYLSRNLHRGLHLSEGLLPTIVGFLLLLATYLYVSHIAYGIELEMDRIVTQFRMGVGTWRGSEYYKKRIKDVRNISNTDKYLSRVVNSAEMKDISKHLSILQSQQQKYQQLISQFYQIKLTDETDQLFHSKSEHISKFFSYITSQRLIISIARILSRDALFYLMCFYLALSAVESSRKAKSSKIVHLILGVKIIVIVTAFMCSFLLMSSISQVSEFDQSNQLSRTQNASPILKRLFIKRNSIQCLNETQTTSEGKSTIEINYIQSKDPKQPYTQDDHLVQDAAEAIKGIVQNRIRDISNEIDCKEWRDYDGRVKDTQAQLVQVLRLSMASLFIIFLYDLFILQRAHKSQPYQQISQTQRQLI